MCCLFGLIDYSHRLTAGKKSKMISVLSKECEVRGTDATGIAYNSLGKLRIYKRPLPARKMHFRIPVDAYAIMGHTRMTTQGSEKYHANNHPFPGRCVNTQFALAHNGVLHNDKNLRLAKRLPDTRIETDSYIAVQLLEHENTLDFSSLKNMAEAVEGSFMFTVLDGDNTVYFVKGDNPICIYDFYKHGFYLYASTPEIFKRALRKLRLDRLPHRELSMKAGDVLSINQAGNTVSSTFRYTPSLSSSYYWPRYSSWGRYYGTSALDPDEDSEYQEELKSVAASFGITPEDIAELIANGLSYSEIEEWLYCEEM